MAKTKKKRRLNKKNIKMFLILLIVVELVVVGVVSYQRSSTEDLDGLSNAELEEIENNPGTENEIEPTPESPQ